MKILILGAGQVGSSVATNLCSEANDITVVDKNSAALHYLQDRLDLRTVVGHASSPDVLKDAGAEDADMIIAVTSSDETNMVACQVAYTIFNTHLKIARIREASYQKHPELFKRNSIPVDVLISPEQEVTDYTRRIIEFPGALQVLDFAGERVQLVTVKAFFGGPLVGHKLRELPEQLPGIETRITTIFRGQAAIVPTGDTVIETGDEILFIAAPHHIKAVMSEFQKLDRSNRRVIIAGGGHIGTKLANVLDKTYRVKVIENNEKQARVASEELKNCYVLHGDATDEELLIEENIPKLPPFQWVRTSKFEKYNCTRQTKINKMAGGSE